jgi:hypothetical protein
MLLLNSQFYFFFSRNVRRRELGSLTVDLPSFNGLAHSTIKFKINQNNENFEFEFNILRLFNFKASSKFLYFNHLKFFYCICQIKCKTSLPKD